MFVDEIDILIGGSEHDMLDSEAQEAILARIGSGEYDMFTPKAPSLVTPLSHLPPSHNWQ
mgnify:CR=1 FL=1